MSPERVVWFIDRWGATIEDDISVGSFAPLLDVLTDDDDGEHVVVDIGDSDEWFLEFSRRSLVVGPMGDAGESRAPDPRCIRPFYPQSF